MASMMYFNDLIPSPTFPRLQRGIHLNSSVTRSPITPRLQRGVNKASSVTRGI